MLPKTLLTLFGLPVLIMSVPDEDNSRSPSFALRKVEGTKRVTRNRTSNRQGQTTQWQKRNKYKKTNNDLQNTNISYISKY